MKIARSTLRLGALIAISAAMLILSIGLLLWVVIQYIQLTPSDRQTCPPQQLWTEDGCQSKKALRYE